MQGGNCKERNGRSACPVRRSRQREWEWGAPPVVVYESWPNQPRASTREHAVVGVAGTPSATNERVRPWRFSVAMRGVAIVGNGTCWRFDMSVIVLGVREVLGAFVGDGGKTKSV
jgi:hypothetical protein